MQSMKRTPHSLSCLCALLILLDAATLRAAQPTPANLSAFDLYAHAVEAQLAQQHQSPAFLAVAPQSQSALHTGQVLLEHLPAPGLDGAILHHWRATAFAPGATAADLDRLLRNFNAYPQHFAPEVTAAHILAATPDHLLATMRVRQHHILTVVMDTTYDITFATPGPRRGYSISRSTRSDELDNRTLRPLSPADQHGFLWRQNTYWSFAERDGGLYLQIESLTLTRSVPTGLAWAVLPFVESIPRESLEFTLRSAIEAIRS
jgi:hypothetical protein